MKKCYGYHFFMTYLQVEYTHKKVFIHLFELTVFFFGGGGVATAIVLVGFDIFVW